MKSGYRKLVVKKISHKNSWEYAFAVPRKKRGIQED